MLRDLFIAVMEIILEEIVRDRNTSTKRIYSSSRKKLINFLISNIQMKRKSSKHHKKLT